MHLVIKNNVKFTILVIEINFKNKIIFLSSFAKEKFSTLGSHPYYLMEKQTRKMTQHSEKNHDFNYRTEEKNLFKSELKFYKIEEHYTTV